MLKQRTRHHERLLEELFLEQECKEREARDETFEQPQRFERKNHIHD